MTIINPQGIKKLKLRKDILKPDIKSKKGLISKRNTIEKDETIVFSNNLILKSKTKK